MITYLPPSNREVGRTRLNQIFEETEKTVQDAKDTAVAVVDQAGQMIKAVAGVALGTGSSFVEMSPSKSFRKDLRSGAKRNPI